MLPLRFPFTKLTVTGYSSKKAVILNLNGTVVAEYVYDAWGRVLSVTGSMADTVGQLNPMRYRGYYYDSETGYYYLQSRYYDPETGRFINADEVLLPLSLREHKNLNAFRYCSNNPIHNVDPNGYASYNKVPTAPYYIVNAIRSSGVMNKAGTTNLSITSKYRTSGVYRIYRTNYAPLMRFGNKYHYAVYDYYVIYKSISQWSNYIKSRWSVYFFLLDAANAIAFDSNHVSAGFYWVSTVATYLIPAFNRELKYILKGIGGKRGYVALCMKVVVYNYQIRNNRTSRLPTFSYNAY